MLSWSNFWMPWLGIWIVNTYSSASHLSSSDSSLTNIWCCGGMGYMGLKKLEHQCGIFIIMAILLSLTSLPHCFSISRNLLHHCFSISHLLHLLTSTSSLLLQHTNSPHTSLTPSFALHFITVFAPLNLTVLLPSSTTSFDKHSSLVGCHMFNFVKSQLA